MDGLRWLLLLVGLLVIAGVYLYSRREKAPADEEAVSPDRVEPGLDGEELVGEPFLVDEEVPIGDDNVEEEEDSTASDAPQIIRNNFIPDYRNAESKTSSNLLDILNEGIDE